MTCAATLPEQNMPLLLYYDDKNYDPTWSLHTRHAVRSIILRDRQVALIKSAKKGFYQFPGGGIDPGETHHQALARETLEEAGLVLLPHTIRPFGIVREIRASQFAPETIFDQTSYYYFAQVQDGVQHQVLEDYEKDLGYQLEWVDMNHARRVNLELCRTHTYKSKFVLREAEILALLSQQTSALSLLDKVPSYPIK